MAEEPQPATIEDLIEGSSYQRTPDGIYYVRPVLVHNLATDPASTLLARAVAALPEGCRFGDLHPGNGTMIVERQQVGPYLRSKTQALAKIYYRDLLSCRIRINGQLTQEITRYDKNGEILSVKYKGGTAADTEPTGDQVETDFAELPLLVPGSIVEFEEVRDAYSNFPSNPATQRGTPLDLQLKYQGRTNSATWQGQPPDTWMCLSIEGQAFGELLTSGTAPNLTFKWLWVYRYVFQFIGFRRHSVTGGTNNQGIVKTFNPLIWFTRRDTRKPPADVNPKLGSYPTKKVGNGWKEVALQGQADFNALYLPYISTAG
jgi:hypothetical protein